MKTEVFFLRLFGLIMLAIGILVWYKGGIFVPAAFFGKPISLPVHIVLLIIGSLLLLVPTLPLRILVAIPPLNKSESLKVYIENLTTIDEPPSEPAELAQYVKGFIRWNNIRIWGLLLVVTCLALTYFMLIQPLLIARSIEQSRLTVVMANLIRAVQDNPLDFSASDNFRHELYSVGPMMEKLGADSSGKRIYKTLTKLYDPPPNSADNFETRLASVYDKEIKPYTDPETSLLNPSFFDVPADSKSYPDSSRAVLFTLLASVCKEQGSQGKFIAPYIQGRQLLMAALDVQVKDDRDLAYAHSSLGANYADTLRNYSSYSGFFKAKPLREKVSSVLKEEQPLSPLALARYADREYKTAFGYAASNFARARCLNNAADLRISLIQKCHLEGTRLEGQGKADEAFLKDNVELPSSESTKWSPHHLPLIMQALRVDLNNALILSREPKIYFTRAQLLSLAGALSDRYKCEVLGKGAQLRSAAVNDLAMAVSLGLSREYFEQERSKDLGLEWLWKFEDSRSKLRELSGSEE